MKVWHIADKSYWGVLPPEAEWAQLLAGAAEGLGLRTTLHVLGDPNDESSPAAAIVHYPAGYVLARHSHAGDRLELVINGSVNVNGAWLTPGDIWASGPRQPYGPHTMGPEGCTTLELGTVGGIRNLTYGTEDNPVVVDFNNPSTVAAAAGFGAA